VRERAARSRAASRVRVPVAGVAGRRAAEPVMVMAEGRADESVAGVAGGRAAEPATARRDDAGPSTTGRAAARVLVRRARLDDAPAIAAVWVETWRTAYRGLVPDAVLDALSVEARTTRWRERLAIEDATLVAERDGAVVGYCRALSGELASLYVRVRGEGIGSALLTAALAGADRPVSLWVFAGNAGARAFYERHGFRPDSAEQLDPGTGVPELRMVRA